MKTIVAKSEIESSPELMIVKAFRIANKRAGEAKRANDRVAFTEFVNKIHFLSNEAVQRGFKIWVNDNGKTGHTYDKDYKLTDEADNNFEQHEARIAARMAGVMTLINSAPAPAPENVQAEPPAGDLDETGLDNIDGLDN